MSPIRRTNGQRAVALAAAAAAGTAVFSGQLFAFAGVRPASNAAASTALRAVDPSLMEGMDLTGKVALRSESQPAGWRARAAEARSGIASSSRRLASLAFGLVVASVGIAARAADKVAAIGDEVSVRYTGRFKEGPRDGKVFDSTDGRKPFGLKLGAGEFVPGFEAAVIGMKVGEKKSVTLKPEQAYGQIDPKLVITIPANQVPKDLTVGIEVEYGGVKATVNAIQADGCAVLDGNFFLAGKTLQFDIELVGFVEQPKKGMTMVGWKGKSVSVPFGLADSPVSKVFSSPQWPQSWPYKDSDFKRQDEKDDNDFYAEPRFVTHIDDKFIEAIKDFYALQFAQAPKGEFTVLDMCSSWISHYPASITSSTGAKRVAVTGMNIKELAANKQADEVLALDLNKTPKFPYGNAEFDFVTNVVSIDYLTKPKEVMTEVHRVLKPGGVAIFSFSNRCFSSKAIAMWVANMNDGVGHCQIIGNYFHFNPAGGWKDISSADISLKPGRSDPVWVVTAVKV